MSELEIKNWSYNHEKMAKMFPNFLTILECKNIKLFVEQGPSWSDQHWKPRSTVTWAFLIKIYNSLRSSNRIRAFLFPLFVSTSFLFPHNIIKQKNSVKEISILSENNSDFFDACKKKQVTGNFTIQFPKINTSFTLLQECDKLYKY